MDRKKNPDFYPQFEPEVQPQGRGTFERVAGGIAVGLSVLRPWKQNKEYQLQLQKLQKENEQLRYESTHDSLTGLLNRRGFDAAVMRSIEESPDNPNFLAVYIDADKLKQLNDRFGHEAGDRGLQAIAELIQDNTREGDVIARTGGDEFCLWLDMTPRETDESDYLGVYPSDAYVSKVEQFFTHELKNRFEQKIMKAKGHCELKEVNFSFTIGVSRHVPGSDTTEAFVAADKRVNAAKLHRNKN